MASSSEDFNEDELEAPKWMDLSFFNKVLRHSENSDQVEVKTFSITPATVKGDHYASIMFRTKVDYIVDKKLKEKSLIIKTMPEIDGQKKDLLQETHIFETEIGMYTEIVPRFEKILREIGDETKLEAPCIYHSLLPNKMIIFEDLVPKGYTVVRNRLLSYEEAKCAYSKLGKWHAISYKILQEDPSYFKKYRYGIFSINLWQENPMFRNGVKYFAEFLKTEPSLQNYVKYFENSHGLITDRAMQSFEGPQEKEQMCYVLCHGDFHMKNVMVKYNSEDEKFEDLMLLDFQMSYVGPMHNDLAYSFYMMLGEDLLIDKKDEVVYEYHQVFIKTLKQIGFKGPVPTLVQLRQQMLKDKYFELFLLTTFMPIWLSFRTGEADIDNLMAHPEEQKALLRNPVFVEQLNKLLPMYLHQGYFEDLV